MKCRYLYHNEKIVALVNFFSENFEMNVIFFSIACALNSFSLDEFYTVKFVTFVQSLHANNLINYLFVSIDKCVTVMTFHPQICTKKSSK